MAGYFQNLLSPTTPRLNKGSSLLELFLVIVIIVVLMSMTIGIGAYFVWQNDLDVARAQTALAWRRAQILSQANNGDSLWGVSIQAGKIVVFKGASYVARDSGFDEESEIATNLSATGITEITFSKVYGLPTTNGTLIYQNTSNQSSSISINAKGTISY